MTVESGGVTPAFDRHGLPHEDEAPLRRSLLRLDALFSPVILESDVDSLDDFLARIGFAIDYNLVLQRFGTANLHYVLLGPLYRPLYQAAK